MEINQQNSTRPKMKGHKLVRSLKQNNITIQTNRPYGTYCSTPYMLFQQWKQYYIKYNG